MTTKKLLQLLVIVMLAACSAEKREGREKSTRIEVENGQITRISGSLSISGVYPHLTTYTHFREDEKQSYVGHAGKEGQRECGIGALAEWYGKLYMVNYAAHEPDGSEHKLYVIDENLNMEIFQGSVGGTPACRLVHQESNQLFIGHYAIDSVGNIRVIDIKKMPGRLTAYARHLKDPENMIYCYDMEGMLYEVNVNTLEPTLLYKNPLPGWHGKGAYTSQGRLVLANNGENHGSFEPTEHWQVDSTGVCGPEKNGVLAQYDGEHFSIVERRQYTDVTTKNGIHAVQNDDSPLWAMGWDKRSLRLKVLDNGEWHTYLLPKAAYNNDPSHGWFTEWPRIREINDGKYMMDMHGMFFNFPSTFSASNTAGISPIASHLRYVPDFIYWNGKLVLATDETSVQGNPLAGQAQSNLWFGDVNQLKEWGPTAAYGSIWLEDEVNAREASLPFLFNGFDRRVMHLNNLSSKKVQVIIELDKQGNNAWEKYKTIQLVAGDYQYLIFPEDLNAQWLRLVPDNAAVLTATLHYTDGESRITGDGKELFAGIAMAESNEKVSHAKLYSNHDNFNLTVHQGSILGGEFLLEKSCELDKYSFEFEQGLKDSTSLKALHNHAIWEEDEASVLLVSNDYRLRLPKGTGTYYSKAYRSEREVESERVLANIHGTFYELPLFKVGLEPLYKMMRPVSTHNSQISDYNTWNGLLVLSGVKLSAKAGMHIVKNDQVALWLGGIDDLWKFGKPVGEGGLWKNTDVKAGTMSDWYLMTGYDKKTVTLRADKDVKITLYVNVSHYSDKMLPYKTFEVKAGEEVTHEFPRGYSAHWVAASVDKDCKSTVWFVYE